MFELKNMRIKIMNFLKVNNKIFSLKNKRTKITNLKKLWTKITFKHVFIYDGYGY